MLRVGAAAAVSVCQTPMHCANRERVSLTIPYISLVIEAMQRFVLRQKNQVQNLIFEQPDISDFIQKKLSSEPILIEFFWQNKTDAIASMELKDIWNSERHSPGSLLMHGNWHTP